MINWMKTQMASLPINEKVNVWTHGIGLLLSILGIPFLLYDNTGINLIALLTFILGMIAMFFSSTVYHITNKDVLKNRWRVVDHISIFLLIGSSYTAFILLYYPTPSGLFFLKLHWGIIIFGILFKLIYKTRYEIVSLTLYLCLGWMVVFIYQEITAQMPSVVENWLLAGSAFYTVGVLFYIQTKLAWNHAIWHIFVMLGCASHYIALFLS
jgi:hemolysin III